MKNKIYIGLLGLGTVGFGVYKVLKMQQENMQQKLGCEVEIKKILVRNMEKAAKKLGDDSLLTNNINDIINDKEIDIVVELMGGQEPARTYMLDALKAGKNVVTANKDIVAETGHELFVTARENNLDIYFEAAVAGGIPIIRPLKRCLAGNNIDEIVGIVNGTTNFILTKMTQEGMDYSQALALATELGYAEADPTADVEGYDAGRKVAIMASVGFNSAVHFSDVYTEGITKIAAKDISAADDMGYVIKLLGITKNTEDGIEASVSPMLIDKGHSLASVNDSFNAVCVHGDAVGDTMFYGRGAGELPTASAVVGDIFDITRNIQNGCTGCIEWECSSQKSIKDKNEICNKYFLRFITEDRCGVLAAVTGAFAKYNVSIEQISQKGKTKDGKAEIVVMTDIVKARNLNASVEAIADLDVVDSIASLIRVYA